MHRAAPLLGRSKLHSSLSGPTDALLAACPFIVSFSEQASFTSFHVQSFYIFLANHSAVDQPHPTKGAEIYCCTQAGGILAATEVCCAGCTPLCAGRCARRLFVLFCSLYVVALTVIFRRPRDFLRDATATVTECSSLHVPGTLQNWSLSDKVRCK